MDEHSERWELTLVEILEQQAFLFSEFVEPDDLPESVSELVEVRIGFRGSSTGECRFACGCDLARELTMNVLGLDEPGQVDLEDAMDAVKELVNVIVGGILAKVAPADGVFDFGQPTYELDDAGTRWTALRSDPSAVALLVEDRPAIFSMQLA